MKTIKFLFAAVLISFLAYGSAGAQLRQAKTTQDWEWYIGCNGEPELITGQFDVHEMIHFKYDNEYYVHWSKIMAITGEAVSQATGEVFRANWMLKMDRYEPGTVFYRSIRFNLVGDRGTHILMAITLKYDWTGGELVVTVERIKELCL